jgi:hypothetical protein
MTTFACASPETPPSYLYASAVSRNNSNDETPIQHDSSQISRPLPVASARSGSGDHQDGQQSQNEQHNDARMLARNAAEQRMLPRSTASSPPPARPSPPASENFWSDGDSAGEGNLADEGAGGERAKTPEVDKSVLLTAAGDSTALSASDNEELTTLARTQTLPYTPDSHDGVNSLQPGPADEYELLARPPTSTSTWERDQEELQQEEQQVIAEVIEVSILIQCINLSASG